MRIRFTKITVYISILLVFLYIGILEQVRFTVYPLMDRQLTLLLKGAMPSTPGSKEACQTIGGTWESIGLSFSLTCVFRFTDGGNVCVGGFQCNSQQCIATSESDKTIVSIGQCASVRPMLGCFREVHFGITDKALCVD